MTLVVIGMTVDGCDARENKELEQHCWLPSFESKMMTKGSMKGSTSIQLDMKNVVDQMAK